MDEIAGRLALLSRPSKKRVEAVGNDILDRLRISVRERRDADSLAQEADAWEALAKAVSVKMPRLAQEISAWQWLLSPPLSPEGDVFSTKIDEVMARRNVPAILALAEFVFLKSTFSGTFCQFDPDGMADFMNANRQDVHIDVEMMVWAGLAEPSPDGRSSFTLTHSGRTRADVRHPALKGYVDPRDYHDDGRRRGRDGD